MIPNIFKMKKITPIFITVTPSNPLHPPKAPYPRLHADKQNVSVKKNNNPALNKFDF